MEYGTRTVIFPVLRKNKQGVTILSLKVYTNNLFIKIKFNKQKRQNKTSICNYLMNSGIDIDSQ